MGLALAHAEQPSLDDLERIGLQIDQEKQQPILRRRQRTILVGRVPPGGARFPIEAPVGHVALERGLKGWDQLLKLVEGQAGEIQELRRARLHIGKLYTGHAWCCALPKSVPRLPQRLAAGINTYKVNKCNLLTEFTPIYSIA